MDKEKFLKIFLIFSGALEIGLGIIFCFMDSILQALGTPSSPGSKFLAIFSGITLIFYGFLLAYSARDIERNIVIPISSCIYRYTVASGLEIYGAILVPILAPAFIAGMIYDIFSATLTLILLKKTGKI